MLATAQLAHLRRVREVLAASGEDEGAVRVVNRKIFRVAQKNLVKGSVCKADAFCKACWGGLERGELECEGGREYYPLTCSTCRVRRAKLFPSPKLPMKRLKGG